MSSNMVAILYLISALLIFTLRGLSHPESSEWATFLVSLE